MVEENTTPTPDEVAAAIENDAFLGSLLDTIDDTPQEEIKVKVEHRRVRIDSPTGILIDYHQAMWETCPDLVNQIVEDILCGLKKGVDKLKARIAKRTERYGEPVGFPGHLRWNEQLKAVESAPVEDTPGDTTEEE